MLERVVIETDAPLDEVQVALSKNGTSVSLEGENMVALVHDARDAEEEVTVSLNDAAIEAYVYLAK